MDRRLVRFTLASASLLLISGAPLPPAFAESQEITLLVFNEQGPLRGCMVHAYNAEGRLIETSVTDSTGESRFRAASADFPGGRVMYLAETENGSGTETTTLDSFITESPVKIVFADEVHEPRTNAQILGGQPPASDISPSPRP